MEKQFLLEDETILVQSNDSSVVLTNRRLLKNMRSLSHNYFISINLQCISTIEIASKSYPLLLALGIGCIAMGPLIGIQLKEYTLLILSLIIGVLFVGTYFFTRYNMISVSSNGGSKIHLFGRGRKWDVLLEFVQKIDQAKSLV